MIPQEFNLGFLSEKSKKPFAFSKLMSELPREGEELVENESLPNEHIFLNDSKDPWYGNILVYL